MIVAMAGLPGTGKSTLARALAGKFSGTVLSKDKIRHALFSERDVEYSAEQDDLCIEIMLQAAAFILARDPERCVFLDGRTFSRRYQIERVAEFTAKARQQFRIIECVCSETTAKRRLGESGDHPAKNRDYELYKEMKLRFEAITLPKLVLDTDQELEKSVEQASADLLAATPHDKNARDPRQG
jgi:adenylylsulfate kinase